MYSHAGKVCGKSGFGQLQKRIRVQRKPDECSRRLNFKASVFGYKYMLNSIGVAAGGYHAYILPTG